MTDIGVISRQFPFYLTQRSQEVQYPLIIYRDGTTPSEMLSLLQEQGMFGTLESPQIRLRLRISTRAPMSGEDNQQRASRQLLTPSLYSRTPNPVSTVVCPILRFESSTLAASVPTLMNSLSASTWSPTNMNSCPPKLLKPPVFAPTSRPEP